MKTKVLPRKPKQSSSLSTCVLCDEPATRGLVCGEGYDGAHDLSLQVMVGEWLFCDACADRCQAQHGLASLPNLVRWLLAEDTDEGS